MGVIGGLMAIAFATLAILVSFIGMFIPMIQALFPRIDLYTYYRQRIVRRGLAMMGMVLLIPVWIFESSTSAWIISGCVIIFWIVSEFVLVPTHVIPPLNNPPALPASQAVLADETQVIGIVLEGQAHAWPMGILIPHHIINESIHSRPVTAAYCPACRSGYIYDPVVDGQRLTFEPVSVHRRNMIMRDRETGTIWQHETGVALMGKYRGKKLEILGGELSNWKAWRTEHPETTLCTRPNGYRHPSPLGPIFDRLLDHGPKHLVGPGLFGIDQRLGQHTFIVGIIIGDIATAYPFDVLQSHRIIHDHIGNTSIVVFYDSVSDRVRCFSTDTFPQKITLEMHDNQLRDPETGYAWDFSGKAIAGTKIALKPVRAERQWWLAWSEYHPGSRVYAARS
jgi:hypothetical protein